MAADYWLSRLTQESEPLWFPWEGHPPRIVLSSVVSFQRNIDGIIFPPFKGQPDQAIRACNTLLNVIDRHTEINLPNRIDPSMLNNAQRDILRFHNLADTAFMAAPDSRLLLLSQNLETSLRINDHNHLLMQRYGAGLQLDSLCECLQSILATISSEVPFAWDKYFGYILHRPELCGTGYTARVHMNLPGIALMGYAAQASKAADKLGFSLNFDQNKDGAFNTHLALLTACNLPNCTPQKINAKAEDFLRRIVQHEQDARKKLCEDPMKSRLRDMVGRARALVDGAYLMSLKEIIRTLSLFWLADDMGYHVHGLEQKTFFRYFTSLLAESQSTTRMKLSEGDSMAEDIRRAASLKEFFRRENRSL